AGAALAVVRLQRPAEHRHGSTRFHGGAAAVHGPAADDPAAPGAGPAGAAGVVVAGRAVPGGPDRAAAGRAGAGGPRPRPPPPAGVSAHPTPPRGAKPRAPAPAGPPTWLQRLQYLLVLALLPAVCKELAFRGFILSGLSRRFHPWAAVFLSAFLFALFQM